MAGGCYVHYRAERSVFKTVSVVSEAWSKVLGQMSNDTANLSIAMDGIADGKGRVVRDMLGVATLWVAGQKNVQAVSFKVPKQLANPPPNCRAQVATG